MYTYLASPYTHDDPKVRQLRYQDVMRVASVFLLNDEIVYSPVLHFHPLAVKYELSFDYKFWEKQNIAMLRGARDFVIVKLAGWETSEGVRHEYVFAKAHDMPIFESKSIDDYKIPLTDEPW